MEISKGRSIVMQFKKIGIAGAGLMGASMSQIFAKYGYDVVVYDAFEASLEKGKRLIALNQQTQVEAGEQTAEQAERILAALRFSSDMNALADCDVIVESIIEKLDIKQEFWAKLSRIVRPDAILTTNTSGLPIGEIAKDIVGKHRFLGMHWMNPSHLIPCIEIIRGAETDDASTEAIVELAHAVGKKTAVCKRRSGHRPRHRCNREEGWLYGRQRVSCNLGIGTPRFPRYAIGIWLR